MSEQSSRFQFYILNTETGIANRIAVTDDQSKASQMEVALRRTGGAPSAIFEKGTGRCRPLVIIGIDETRTDSADGLQVGDEFPSAHDLDMALGFNYPAVSQALSMQARFRPAEVGAKLRGVQVQFKDVWEKHLAEQASANTRVD